MKVSTRPLSSRAYEKLAKYLEANFQKYHHPDYLGTDPLVMVRRFNDPEDREIAALFAALLAYGNVRQINASLARLFDAMGNRPGAFVRKFKYEKCARALRGFKHRFADERDILCLCLLLHQAIKSRPLQEGFALGIKPSDTDLAGAAGAFVDYLQDFPFEPFDRSEMLGRSSFKHLMPRADRGSACKRIHLFLRWMVRADDGIDLGLWTDVDAALLLVPVDTHIHNVSQQLGLCRLATPSLKFSREVTSFLRRLDPADPTRFDFSLCRVGMLGDEIPAALLCPGVSR